MTPSPNFGATLQTSVRRVFYPISEVIRLGTVYLGLAALVASILMFSVPSLRTQVQHVHGMLVGALQHGGLRVPFNVARSGAAGMDPTALAQVSPAISGDELPWPLLSADDADAIAQDVSGQVTHLNFIRALVDSEEDYSIPGVTNTQAQALRSYIARKYRIAENVAGALIASVFTVGRNMDLDPQLLLAVIAIESRYNPYAESSMGAQGLMQVMTRVHKDKFAALGEGALAAIHPLANIQVGAQILSDCIRRRGSLDGGLSCYVGATGPSDGGYGAKVKAERRRIALASGIPIQ